MAGAVIGAVVNSAVSAYTQYKNTGKVDFRTTLGVAAAFGTANLAGSLLKAGSSVAAQASAKATGSAGMQAAAKAGGSALGKMVTASAAGGITGMAAGVSADLAVQTTEILSGMSDGYDLERTKNSALLGGAVGVGLGAASQTPLVQKAGAKFNAWDAVLKEKTGNIGEGFQASMADNRGFADFDALSGKKTAGGGGRFPENPDNLFPKNYQGLKKDVKSDGKINYTVQAGDKIYKIEYHPRHEGTGHYDGNHYHVLKLGEYPQPGKTKPPYFRIPNLDPNTPA